MLKLFASGGPLFHSVAGAWSLVQAAAQTEPVNWFSTSLHALGPGLLGLAAAVIVTLATRPPEVLTFDQDAA